MSCLPLLLTKVALREKREREKGAVLCSGVLPWPSAFCLLPSAFTLSARYMYFHFTSTFTFTFTFDRDGGGDSESLCVGVNEPGWTGLCRDRLDWTGRLQSWTGLDWAGLDWTGLDWTQLAVCKGRLSTDSIWNLKHRKKERKKKVRVDYTTYLLIIYITL